MLIKAQAGLFSAVASAFIIQVDPQLQPDSNDETAALLRVLIYKIDNTTFGKNVPTLPQWNGPPRAMVQVQAILFASLAISLLSAFLAMLGKQWLNRYQSADMRGSAVERSNNRQRKLGGIVAWYFEHVMETLPLMLQTALLLLGCALSRYLWGVDVAVALVVLSVTSLGAIFYLFIVIAGTASESCPYQTPAAHVLRRILHHIRHTLPTIHSASALIYVVVSSNFFRLYEASSLFRCLATWWSNMKRPWYLMHNAFIASLAPIFILRALTHDILSLGLAIVHFMVACRRRVYHQFAGGKRIAYRWFIDISSLRTLRLEQQSIKLDLECISWVLHTSLDNVIHLSAFKHLVSIPGLVHFHSTLVLHCFNIFVRCIGISNNKVVVVQGLEQLATVSASGFFRTLHHLATVDPTSSVLTDLRRRYNEIFPSEFDFTDLPFQSMMINIHTLAGQFGDPRDVQWHSYRMTVQEHVPFAERMVRAAQEGYQQTRQRKVPRWILRSALYFLSLAPASPPSVIADCLTVVAIDLGCDVEITVISDERCVQNLQVATFLTENQITDEARFESYHSETQNHGGTCRFGSSLLKTQSHQHPVPIRNTPGAKRATQDG